MRYKRLNYGTKSAQDHMHIELGKCLAGIPMQVNISDDIMIGGRNEEEHDEALERVLERLRENGLTVKKEKCIFDAEEVTFAGLVISTDGIRPSEKNVRNLKQATKPTNKAELRSFLGLATYSERFIPKFASIVAPLRELIKGKDKKWKWEDKHETAYDEVKEALSKDALLHHYVVGRETELVVDMSDKGLGAVLLQRASKREPYRPVVYKSRSLKDPETRYSATEREALAIRWAVKKLYRYLVGAPRFKIVTDHRPLRFMFHKKCGDIPPRIEKFIMDIQEYDYEVEYRPGKTCIADYMSRHPTEKQGSGQTEVIENYVMKIVEVECCQMINEVSAVTIEKVKEVTRKDKDMQRLIDIIQSKKRGKKKTEGLEPYLTQDVFRELNVVDGVVCRGTRIVIPADLQKEIIRIGHEAHPGMSKTKNLLRSCCWFPGMDSQVESKTKRCIPCQAVQPATHKEPIKPKELPDGPWQRVEMESSQGPYPNGEYIFVMIDQYSRWPEIKVLKRAPNHKTTIKAMKEIFAREGTPESCQSDNGQPFRSFEMKKFAKEQGYEHKFITPIWPRANGTVERFNRGMKEAIQTLRIDGVNSEEAAREYVAMYRAAPHSATKVSPFESMHGGRKMRTKLPMMKQNDDVIDREEYKKYQEKMTKTNKKEHKIEEGDKVLVMQKKRNKFTPKFDPKEYQVIKVQGSMITARRGRQEITRNAEMFKVIHDKIDEARTDKAQKKKRSKEKETSEEIAVEKGPGITEELKEDYGSSDDDDEEEVNEDIEGEDEENNGEHTRGQEVGPEGEEPQGLRRSERRTRRPTRLADFECS